jgi:integrase
MLNAGMPVGIVSHRLGHSDSSVTLKNYAKYIKGEDALLVAAMERLLAA